MFKIDEFCTLCFQIIHVLSFIRNPIRFFLSNLVMYNAHESKIVFSPYSLKIHIKEKNIIYNITKCHLFPQTNSISKPNFSSTTCNNDLDMVFINYHQRLVQSRKS
ncbi:hypothetical protein Hanom_Chr01g00069671 [Helianthus anomalus]